jgi:hypothetical protein
VGRMVLLYSRLGMTSTTVGALQLIHENGYFAAAIDEQLPEIDNEDVIIFLHVDLGDAYVRLGSPESQYKGLRLPEPHGTWVLERGENLCKRQIMARLKRK